MVRSSSDEAWRVAEAKVAKMADDAQRWRGFAHDATTAEGQRRLLEVAARGDVVDTCLYTAPGRYGGSGAATTWLVGSYDDVADALWRYRQLGVTHFVLSDTPYRSRPSRWATIFYRDCAARKSPCCRNPNDRTKHKLQVRPISFGRVAGALVTTGKLLVGVWHRAWHRALVFPEGPEGVDP